MEKEGEKLSFLLDSLKKGVKKLEEAKETSRFKDYEKIKEVVLKIQENIGVELNELSKN